MKKKYSCPWEKLEEKIGYRFKKKTLLEEALTHRSWLNEHSQEKRSSNERLEFLGDAVLELWITKNLFFLFPSLPEGKLTNLRTALVRTETLAAKASTIGLGKFLFLSRGEEKNQGRTNPSILADAFEALIGAIFVDGGEKASEKFLKKFFLKELKEKGRKGEIKDAKTKFQEIAQAKFKITPTYQVVKETGPDHHKFFKVALLLGKKKIATAGGWSKQEAEEKAAAKGLSLLEKREN